MTETLGQAVLELRTDDTAFTAGVNRAEVAANGLGRKLDECSGSSVALAERMRNSVTSIEGVTRATGAQRQGLIQLTQQLGDASTMFALGARPMQIFASQLGQIADAIRLAAGEGSKLAAFLSGPWGIAIMVAVQVLGPLIGKLFDTGAAADDTANKLRGAADAARELAGVSNALKLNKAQMDLNALRDERLRLENMTIAPGTSEAGRASAAAALANRDRRLMEIAQQELAQQSIISLAEEQNAALDATKTKNGRGASAGRSRGTGSASAGDTLAFARELGTVARQELQAKQALATSAEERLDIQMQILSAERDEKIRTIDANKNFSADQKAAMKAYIDRLYGKSGKVGPDGSIVVDGPPGLLGQAATRKFEEEQARIANDMLQRQAETAQAWAQVSRSSTERARLEARALELQQQIETNLLEQQIATGQVADAEKARAELRSQQEAARKGLADRTAGPLAQYADQLQANKEDSGRRVEALMVEELDYVHRSISDSISSRLGVEDPFLKGLIDMFIEDVFIRPMAEALRNASAGGGGSGLFSSLVGTIFGGGASPQASLAGDVASTIADPQFAGLFAGGGLIPDGAWGIVGDAGPEPIRATAGGIEVLPNSSLRAIGGGAGGMPGTLKVEISGARGNREIQEMVSAGVAQGLAAYDSSVAGRVREQSDRRF